VVEIRGTMEELRELFLASAITEAKRTAKRAGTKAVKEVVKRAPTAWTRFLKAFKFRKRRKNEANSTYLGLRSKAASRAYKRRGKK
jgi:hypothetical protein